MWEITTAYEREAQRIQHNFQAMLRTAERPDCSLQKFWKNFYGLDQIKSTCTMALMKSLVCMEV